jgi:hypothetical protein
MSTGPYETEQEALADSLWVTHGKEDPDVDMDSYNIAGVAAALAGVELGAYDKRIVEWLAGWEPSTVAVVCGWITRARQAGRAALAPAVLAGNCDLTGEEIRTVFDALDVAADYKRDRAAHCPDCEASPAERCGTCEWRLAMADEYDRLAGTLWRPR